MGTPFDSVKAEEQILRYRQLATEALTIAGTASDKNVKAAYLVMASDWHMLAAELEHDLETAEPVEDASLNTPKIQGVRPPHERSKAGRAQRRRR